MVSDFLAHLETSRHNSVRTRNARRAAIRSFFRFASLRHPEHAALIARVLDIPTKHCDRAVVSYLNEAESDALVAAPTTHTWCGRRDRALLATALQTGLRVSELTGLRNCDVELGTGAHVRCRGKGRNIGAQEPQAHLKGPNRNKRTPIDSYRTFSHCWRVR